MTGMVGVMIKNDPILSTADVARLFKVDGKTIARWAQAGQLPEGFRTMGGHRRWYESEILAIVPGVRADR
jgi:predicted DNA-binding transcriptional regulator AlpA